ncbi:MAG TPA: hypothetical protein VMW27_25425 [Thermoanaerobaculia bacterium]|nr:hypothetical protein [Thermoanaerobaculia bacterium]
MLKRKPSTRFVTPHSAAQRWPRRTSTPSLFTAFVRSLQGAGTPDADLFHDAWHGLRAVLVGEMKKRGLWQSSPSYLGIYGWERWDSEEPGGDPRAQAALGELVADCYAFIFVDRLQSLKRHLQDKPDIDGLVRLNIRHFLHERQKGHDPLGYRVFELLQAAVEEAVACGELYLLAGDRKIRNDTLLGFHPAAEPQPAPPDLERIVMRWNDELVPALIAARTRQQPTVAQLRVFLLELPGRGIEAFRFRDLLEPLKRDARGRWAALLGKEEKGSVAPPPGAVPAAAPVPPGSTAESRQSFEDLTRCVSTSIDRMDADLRTRTQLATLWHYLWRQQGEGASRVPSHRQLSRCLNIPRERLPLLFALLRQIMPRG